MTTTRPSNGRERPLDLGPDDNDCRPQGKRPRMMPSASSSPPRKSVRHRKPLGTLSDASINQKGGNGSNANASDISSPAAPKKQGSNNNAAALITVSKDKTAKARRKSAPGAISAAAASSNTVRLSVTPEEKKTRLPPKSGDRFRVKYDKAGDVFGKDTARAKGYFYGTVTAARQQTSKNSKAAPPCFKLTIAFDSGDIGHFDYPCEESTLERLMPSCEGPNLLMGEITGDFAGDTNPARLDVGDLVFCNYQGKERRYRGRIAAVSEDGKTCDIAYDDDEYEYRIPVGDDYIVLVEDGRSFMHWLEGITMKFPIGASKREAQVTIRVSKDEDVVRLEHANGSVEKQSYHRVVLVLFAQVKRRCETKPWPFTRVADLRAGSNDIKSDLSRSRMKSPPARATQARKGAPGVETACLPQHFATDPWMSDVSDDEDGGEEEATVPGKQMSNSIRNSFWKALNSPEGHFGADLLFKMTNFHNIIPNDELCRDLITLLWKGPLHQKVQFPDCVRMGLATNYLDLLKTKGMVEQLANALPSAFVPDYLEQVETPAVIYCVEGDESRVTSAALKRVGQSLNVKNSGASLLLYLLQRQMKGYTRFGKHASEGVDTTTEMEEFKRTLGGRPLTRDIIGTAGSTQALKSAVRATFSILVHYGHYLSNDLRFPAVRSAPEASVTDRIPPRATTSDRTFVAAEVKILLKSMGRICGYLAWLQSIEHGKSVYETRYLIRDTVDGMVSSATFDPSMFLADIKGMKNKSKRLNRHWSDMKLQFALSLDKRISGNLGKLVAELFNVGTKYF